MSQKLTKTIDSKIRQREAFELMEDSLGLSRPFITKELNGLSSADFRRKYLSKMPKGKKNYQEALIRLAKQGSTLQTIPQLKRIKGTSKPKKIRKLRNKRFTNSQKQIVDRKVDQDETSLNRCKNAWELKDGQQGVSFQQVQIRKPFYVLQRDSNGNCDPSTLVKHFFTASSGISTKKDLVTLYSDAEDNLLEWEDEMDKRYGSDCIIRGSQSEENIIIWRFIKKFP